MHHIFNTNSQILKWYFSKHPLSMHRNTWHCIHWMLTSCLLFSAVHCLHSTSLVCFTGQWGSALTVNIGFCFSLPKSLECYNQPLAKFHLETQLGSCNFTATVNCQLVVWWRRLLHTNVGIHNHKNYQKPQQIFSPFFWHVAYRELHAYLISSIYSKQLSVLLLTNSWAGNILHAAIFLFSQNTNLSDRIEKKFGQVNSFCPTMQ